MDSKTPWRWHVRLGTLLVAALLFGPFVYRALAPTTQRNLDAAFAFLNVLGAFWIGAFVVAVGMTFWIAVVARAAGRPFPRSGFLPLGVIGMLIALGVVGMIGMNLTKPEPSSAPVSPTAPPTDGQ